MCRPGTPPRAKAVLQPENRTADHVHHQVLHIRPRAAARTAGL
jgi:hypothetical protein